MPVRRSLILFTLILFVGPLVYFGLQTRAPQAGGGASADDGSSTNIQYHVVSRGDVTAVVSAVGNIEADESIDVGFTTAGRLTEVFVKPTDYVLAGDLLARLENDNQRIAYDQAVLALELVEIELDDLLGPVDGDEVRIAEANVDAAWGNYRGSLNSASRGQIEAAELQIDQAQSAVDTAIRRRIYGGDFTSQEQIDLADAEIGEATFNLEISRLQLQDLLTGDSAGANAAYLAYEQALAELDRVLAGPSDLEIEQAEARVAQAEARLKSTEEALAKTEIRAPFDGVIADVFFEPGALIGPGIPVLTMVDIDPLSLTVQIDEIDIGNIEPGMPVEVEVDALSNQFLDAQLEKISLVGQQTQGGIVNYDAEIKLLEVDPRVRVGMTSEANIIINQENDVLVVPNAFIRLDRRRNEAFVQVVNDLNEFEEIPIELGLRGEEYSEVIAGLSEGDIIAADLTGNQFSLFGGGE